MKKFLIAAVTFAAMLVSFQLWFQDWILTFCVMASVALHEAGHAIALNIYGVKVRMVFVPFLGAAVIHDKDDHDKLNFGQYAWVTIAGPLVNAVLIIIGFVVATLPGTGNYGIGLASINVGLLWFNLLPFKPFDGGKFAENIFESLDEESDKIAATVIGAGAILSAAVLFLFGHVSIPFALLYFGIKRASNADDPANAHSPKAMNNELAGRLLILYVVILFGSMILSPFMPNWIELFHVWPAN